MPRRLEALLSLALALAAYPARAAEPNWDQVAEVGTVEILTHDEDGDARETKIWFVVVDGQGFIRTGNSNWVENIRRDPRDVVLRIEDREYPLRAEFIENDGLRERVVAAFRAKYGWSDGAVQLLRGKRPNIMHMISR
ncbi:MAG: DUF2255 family protein [Myxococcota bacterium]